MVKTINLYSTKSSHSGECWKFYDPTEVLPIQIILHRHLTNNKTSEKELTPPEETKRASVTVSGVKTGLVMQVTTVEVRLTT